MKTQQSTFYRINLFVVFVLILAWASLNIRAAKASDGFSCEKSKVVDVDGKPSDSSKTSLLERFPDISSVLNTTSFRVSNKWVGESLLSPAVFEVTLALEGDRFEGESHLHYGIQGGKVPLTKNRNIVVSRDIVRAFLCVALQVHVEERAYKPYMTHTDDYPDLNLTFHSRSDPLTIFTQSQPHIIKSRWLQTPWAISYADRVFVVTAPDMDYALKGLLPSLDMRLQPEE